MGPGMYPSGSMGPGMPGRSQIMQGPPGPPGPPGSHSGQAGKVLISKTGNQLKLTSLGQQNMPMVPPGVTVTPAPHRILNSSNISIRKMGGMGGSISSSGVGLSISPGPHHGQTIATSGHSGNSLQGQMGQHIGVSSHSRESHSLQTSPDSTSQEPEPGSAMALQDAHDSGDTGVVQIRQQGNQEMDTNVGSTPDSQGFESQMGKRSSDSDLQDIETKRLKSDGSET